MKKLLATISVVSMMCLVNVNSASAAVINSGDVNGLKTFQDTNTGRIWLDMNNFFNKSTTDMVSIANKAGFIFATKSDVSALLGSLPLTNGEWTNYSQIMGSAPNRDLIWGSYDDGSTSTVGWAWAFSSDKSWNIVDNTWMPSEMTYDSIPNADGDSADLNIWAYAPVPEPASMILGLMSLGGLAGLKNRAKKA